MSDRNPSELRENLNATEIEDHWEEVIEGQIEEAETATELLEWIETYRDETLSILDDVGDRDDVHTSLVLRYIEMKCRWIILNNQIQYQAVETGSPEDDMMVKASLLSNLLERLENWLDEEEVESITTLLSQPVEALTNRF